MKWSLGRLIEFLAATQSPLQPKLASDRSVAKNGDGTVLFPEFQTAFSCDFGGGDVAQANLGQATAGEKGQELFHHGRCQSLASITRIDRPGQDPTVSLLVSADCPDGFATLLGDHQMAIRVLQGARKPLTMIVPGKRLVGMGGLPSLGIVSPLKQFFSVIQGSGSQFQRWQGPGLLRKRGQSRAPSNDSEPRKALDPIGHQPSQTTRPFVLDRDIACWYDGRQ